MRKNSIVFFVLGCVVGYLLISLYRLNNPGPYSDELLFVNAARHDRPDNTLILSMVGKLPLMLIHYIGALKSYLYFPIFKIFGVDLWTIRIPVILVTVVSLMLIFWLSRRIFSLEFALVVLLLLSFDPSLIYMTRLDYGPNALELLLKCLSGLFFYRYFLAGKGIVSLLWGLFFLALGIFNKLNFIWYSNALFAIVFLFNAGTIIRAIRQRDFSALKPFLLIAAVFLLFIYWLFQINSSYGVLNGFNSGDLSFNVGLKFHVFKKILVGTNYLDILYSDPQSAWTTFQLYLYSGIILAGAILHILFPGHGFIRANRRKWAFLVLMLVIHILQILITREAFAAWHAFTIYPFFTILLVYSIFTLRSFIGNTSLSGRLITILLVTAVFSHQGFIISRYFRMLGSHPASMLFSDKATELTGLAKQHKGMCISLDWGLHNLMITADDKKGKYIELLPFLINGMSTVERDWVIRGLMKDTATLFVTHPRGMEVFPNAVAKFDSMIDSVGLARTDQRVIKDGKKRVYLIFRLKNKANPMSTVALPHMRKDSTGMGE